MSCRNPFLTLRCGDFLCRPAPPPPQARTGAAAMTCTDLRQQNDLDGPSHNKHIKRTKCPGVCTKVRGTRSLFWVHVQLKTFII